MDETSSRLSSSVVSFSDKDTDIGFQSTELGVPLSPSNLYNGNQDNDGGVLTPDSSPAVIAIINKNISTTKINDIQTIQVLNRLGTIGIRAIGLAIELYNSKNDLNLDTILAKSNEITEQFAVYRFDFSIY